MPFTYAKDFLKNTKKVAGKRVTMAASKARGLRLTFEDTYIIDNNLFSTFSTEKEKLSRYKGEVPYAKELPMTAVFDGHCGDEVAKFAEMAFSRHMRHKLWPGTKITDQMIEEAFLEFDLKTSALDSGAAAITTLFDFAAKTEEKEDRIICANIGDCRGLLYNNQQMISISNDHTPNQPLERERIEKAGSYIKMGRVEGNINLSRAFGDFNYKMNPNVAHKDQAMTAFPEIISYKVEGFDNEVMYNQPSERAKQTTEPMNPENASFVLLGSDGLWNNCATTNEALLQFVVERMKVYKLFDNTHQVSKADFYKFDEDAWYNKSLEHWEKKNWDNWHKTLNFPFRGSNPLNAILNEDYSDFHLLAT